MKILIADDDLLALRMIESLLGKWGYEIITVSDGNRAWEILQTEGHPYLVILDRLMPGMEGTEICRKFRRLPYSELTYIILLTSRGHKNDIVTGLDAGANDYITKPFDHEELRARVNVGRQMTELQLALANRVKQLEEAASHIKTLQSIILPICSYCKKIRDDKNYWQQLESYFAKYSHVRFSHGICPDCYEKHVIPELNKLDIAMRNM